MSRRPFVLEMGFEEMPARFLPDMEQQVLANLPDALDAARLDADAVQVVSTPRRLTSYCASMAVMQRTEEELFIGPPWKAAFSPDGQPLKPALGFAAGHGANARDLFAHDTPRGAYAALRKQVGGRAALDILPQVVHGLIAGLGFAKKMRWADREFQFGRPLRWLLCLLGADVVPAVVAGIEADRRTFGHRVMGFGPWSVPDAAAYWDIVRDQGQVLMGGAARAERIVAQGDALARDRNARIIWKQELLDEVIQLVEHPRAVMGGFDPVYLELPREVLLTSMEKHQKSFGVEDCKGTLMPQFLTVINLRPKDENLVRKGWERVLKARLEDARFFFQVDSRADAEAWLAMLDHVTFLAPLGSMGDKSRRLERLSRRLATRFAPACEAQAARAGLLAKMDLVSEMVKEFAELQGTMGGIYAVRQGEAEEVAKAISEQYLPLGPDSAVPESRLGALLAMADKADTLAGCFGLTMIPTGAADPYALRRAALGVCRIIMEHGFRLDLRDVLSEALENYDRAQWQLSPEEALKRLLDFFGQRLRAFFVSQGYATRIVDAAVGAGFADVFALRIRVSALEEFSRTEDFAASVQTFKRMANIIRKQAMETEEGRSLNGKYRVDLLLEPQERELARIWENFLPRWDALWIDDRFPDLLGLLREVKPFVDGLFDHVMVMCPEADLRINRLNLLKSMMDRFDRLADFPALQV
ncbi:MAG TPA: glycine--tRNA ligase subunit beta [Desulfonatronum sp.]|nr:glycine--tRNA ligase subunit beta [Desulfonatronum sp.]